MYIVFPIDYLHIVFACFGISCILCVSFHFFSANYRVPIYFVHVLFAVILFFFLRSGHQVARFSGFQLRHHAAGPTLA